MELKNSTSGLKKLFYDTYSCHPCRPVGISAPDKGGTQWEAELELSGAVKSWDKFSVIPAAYVVTDCII